MQDLPILLQLVFWYAIFYESLPPPSEAFCPGAGIFLCKRGVAFTVPEAHPAHIYMLIAFVLGCVATYFIRRWARKRQERTGQYFPVFRASLALIIGLPLIAWLAAGYPMKMDAPKLTGFNFVGVSQSVLSSWRCCWPCPVHVRLCRRSGSCGNPIGQQRAERGGHVHRPQADSGSQPGHLASGVAGHCSAPDKPDAQPDENSSLAVAIGYPDFVSVANTTINQTGQSIEGVALIMAVYLVFSLSTSAFMNWYNKRVASWKDRPRG